LDSLSYSLDSSFSLSLVGNQKAHKQKVSFTNYKNLSEIIEGCLSGDRKAQGALYRKYYGYLMSICLRYDNNELDASASLNLGFYKILISLDRYDSKTPFEFWIKRIMINQCIDDYRKNKRHQGLLLKEEIRDGDLMVSSAVFNEANEYFTKEHLARMLSSLPDLCSSVFNLFAIDGYSHKEIAELLDIPEGTSKWYLSEARKKLKELLLKEFPHLNAG
jgi:RNA polymerase sigma factor (sigma-70 family)